MSQRPKDGNTKRAAEEEGLNDSGSKVANNFKSFICPLNAQIKET